jgi:hypothetical protein
MPRKRSLSGDAVNPLPPRKSTRLVSKAVASLTRPEDDSSGLSNTVTPRSDDNNSPGPYDSAEKGQNDSSQGKTLSTPALDQEVTKIVENKYKAEIMILALMRKYSFDLSHLQALLTRKANQPQVA